MSSMNAFALLGNDDDDYISALISHATSKAGAAAASVPRSTPPSGKKVEKAKFPVKQADSGRGERGQRRGGHGPGSGWNGLFGDESIQSQNRGRGSVRNGLNGNCSVQFQNKQADPYQRSYWGSNGYPKNSGGSNGYQNDKDGPGSDQRNYRGSNGYQRNYRGSNGYQRNPGGGYGWNYGSVYNGNAVDERNQGNGGRERVLNENQKSQDNNQINTRNEQIKSEGQKDDGQIKSQGKKDDGEVWEQVNKYHGKGYGGGSQMFTDFRNGFRSGEARFNGRLRMFTDFRNGNISSSGDSRGNGGGRNGFRSGEVRFNGRRQPLNHEIQEILNDNYEKKGDNSKKEEGDRRESKEENHGKEGHEINANDSTGGPEGKMSVTKEGSNSGEPRQGKLAEETRKDAGQGRKAAIERQNQMTLEEYEKKLLEKRKNSPGLQKNEGKRVIAHEEFESMQRLERKKDNIPSIKLKAVNGKLKRNGSHDKVDRVHKATVCIDEFLNPAEGGRQPPRRRWHEERAAKSDEEESPAVLAEAPPPATAPCIEDQLQFPVLGGALKV